MSTEFQDTADYVTGELMKKLTPRLIELPEGRTYLVYPDMEGRWCYENVTSPNKAEVLAPKIIAQAVKLQTVDAFGTYLDRFKNPDSVIFADIATNTVLGVIDYHTGANQPGPAQAEEGVPPGVEPKANHAKHTASLTIPHSLEWQTWMAIDGRLMPHVEFSAHLEENAMDILPLDVLHNANGEVIEDAPTTILELCRELQVRSSYGASSEIRNGDYASIEMQKGDDVTTKRNIALPVSIDLHIPVYFGERPVIMKAFIRRKVVEGSLRLGVKLQRPEMHRQDEFRRIVDEIERHLGLTTVYGKPA